jgi:hypothetical protein
MKPAHIALILQLCLVACVAAAATPEQEMEAEAKKWTAPLTETRS